MSKWPWRHWRKNSLNTEDFRLEYDEFAQETGSR